MFDDFIFNMKDNYLFFIFLAAVLLSALFLMKKGIVILKNVFQHKGDNNDISSLIFWIFIWILTVTLMSWFLF